MSEVQSYGDAYYSMTWMGPKGYPENGNSGRCYFTGLLGMFRLHGESDVLFADGTSGDGFSFRWTPGVGRAGLQRRRRRVSRDLGIHPAGAGLSRPLGTGSRRRLRRSVRETARAGRSRHSGAGRPALLADAALRREDLAAPEVPARDHGQDRLRPSRRGRRLRSRSRHRHHLRAQRHRRACALRSADRGVPRGLATVEAARPQRLPGLGASPSVRRRMEPARRLRPVSSWSGSNPSAIRNGTSPNRSGIRSAAI